MIKQMGIGRRCWEGSRVFDIPVLSYMSRVVPITRLSCGVSLLDPGLGHLDF